MPTGENWRWPGCMTRATLISPHGNCAARFARGHTGGEQSSRIGLDFYGNAITRHDSGRGLTNWLPSSSFTGRLQAVCNGSVTEQAAV